MKACTAVSAEAVTQTSLRFSPGPLSRGWRVQAMEVNVRQMAGQRSTARQATPIPPALGGGRVTGTHAVFSFEPSCPLVCAESQLFFEPLWCRRVGALARVYVR